MDAYSEAVKRVLACEVEIQRLIAELLAARRYDEIQDLVALAGRVASTVRAPVNLTEAQAGVRSDSLQLQTAVQPASRLPSHGTDRLRSKRRKAGDYPRFERHGDRLVKVGWSKKDRSEYEHKAPLEVARAVLDAVLKAAGEGDYVRIESFLPVIGVDDQEIPSYQVYLVVAWLREMEIIERVGHEGYRFNVDRDHVDFEVLWTQTAESR